MKSFRNEIVGGSGCIAVVSQMQEVLEGLVGDWADCSYYSGMATLQLTDDQVIELAGQLSADKQQSLLERLVQRVWPRWAELSEYGQERVRTVATQRGFDWEAMTEIEREAFIDKVVHED